MSEREVPKLLSQKSGTCYTLRMKTGFLKQNGVHLRDHEYHTVKLFLEHGYDVELIPPSTIKGLQMPDIMMAGVPWEIKSPEGNSRTTIKHTMQKAMHQSNNVIVDLRRCGVNQDAALKELDQYFKLSRRAKRMKVVAKTGEILDFSK